MGISPDDQKAQSQFARKYDIGYPLLCDSKHTVAEAYGARVEKRHYGRKYIGIQRSTFVIAPDGTLARVFPEVKIEGHVQEVLEAAKELMG